MPSSSPAAAPPSSSPAADPPSSSSSPAADPPSSSSTADPPSSSSATDPPSSSPASLVLVGRRPVLVLARVPRRRTSSHHRMDSTQHGYKVGFPPKKSLLTEFSDAVKETFFADDPLQQYKDQPRSKKIWLGLQYVFPVLDWGRHYTLGKFKGDLIAGLTIASLCIPRTSASRSLLTCHQRLGCIVASSRL